MRVRLGRRQRGATQQGPGDVPSGAGPGDPPRTAPPVARDRPAGARRRRSGQIAAGIVLAVAVAGASLWFVDARSPLGPLAADAAASRRPARSSDGAAATGTGVAGVVRDGSGAPAPGAWVALRPEEPLSAGRPGSAILAATAGPGGRFEVGGLAPGTYGVTATFGAQAAERAALVVGADRTVSVELRLAPAISLSGRVLDAGGAPVPRARVTAVQDEAAAGLAFQTEADDAGSYALALPGGAYVVTVDAAGAPRLVERLLVVRGTARDLNLPPGTRVAGRLVATGSAAAVADAEVTLLGLSPSVSSAPATTRSRADGTFAFESVAAGSYRVHARSGGFQGACGPVRVGPGAQDRDVVVALGPAATVTGKVRVLGRAEGVEGAAVLLVPRGLDPGPVAAARTGADGTFRVEGVADGGYTLRVDAGARGRAVRPVEVVGVDRAVEVALAPAVTVRGRVVDGRGAPVEGATVGGSLATGDGPLPQAVGLARTAGDGSFELARFGGGDLRLTARGDGVGIGGVGPLPVGDQDGPALLIVLDRGAHVSGQVRFDDGRPAAGVRVQAAPSPENDGPRAAAAITAEDGTYRIGPFAAGPLSLWAGGAGRGDGDRTPEPRVVTVVPGIDQAGVDLVVAGGGKTLSSAAIPPQPRPLDASPRRSPGDGG